MFQVNDEVVVKREYKREESINVGDVGIVLDIQHNTHSDDVYLIHFPNNNSLYHDKKSNVDTRTTIWLESDFLELNVKETNPVLFENGDKVYYPTKSNKILTLIANHADKEVYKFTCYFINEVDEFNNVITITVDGKISRKDMLPVVFKATDENREILEQLYGVEFEKRKSANEIVRDIVWGTDKSVFAYVAESSEITDADVANGRFLPLRVVKDFESNKFVDSENAKWKYAKLVDIDIVKNLLAAMVSG